jgi:hypothetical protein
MKTILLKAAIIFNLFAVNISLLGQSIPNPYFEWFDSKNRETPANWDVLGLCSKEKGIKLSNNKATDQYSTVSLVKFDNFGRQAPAFKINGTPDSLKVSFESALDKDTAFIYFYAMKSGDSAPAVFQEIMIYGTHTAKTLGFALDYIHPDAGVVCDTAYIIIYSANPVNGPLSSGSINISGLQLSAQKTPINSIPNHNFSAWNSTGVTYPGDWTTHHMLAFNSGLNGNFMSRSTDAQTGTSALWLKGFIYTEPNAKNDSFPAFAITTRSRNMMDLITPDLDKPSFSYIGRPQSFRGYAKTQLVTGDRLMGFVYLFNADTIVGSTIIKIDSTNGKYNKFETDINWLPGYTGNCDKATIAFYISDSSGLKMVSAESQAWIDNIEFGNFGVKSTAVKKNFSMGIYPNPAVNQTSVVFSGIERINLLLMNTEGRIVRTYPGVSNGDILALGGLKAGIYLLSSPETGITQKIILKP